MNNEFKLKSALGILLLFLTGQLFGQGLRYERLDSLSRQFSAYQSAASGYAYNDNTQNYTVSFPADNFKIWYYNKSVSYAVYKKWGDREVLASTDNIDLTKLDSIQWLNTWQASNTHNLFVFRLYFPTKSLSTKLYENGKLTSTIQESYIDYFLAVPTINGKTSVTNWNLFLMDFVELVNRLREEKAGKPLSDQAQLRAKWIKTVDNESDNSASTDLYAFITANKNSLYVPFAKKMAGILRNMEIEEENKLKRMRAAVYEIGQEFKFKSGLSLGQFVMFNTEANALLRSEPLNTDLYTNYSIKMTAKNYLGNPWSEGSNSMSVHKKLGTVDAYGHVAFAGSWDDVVTYHNQLVSRIKSKVDGMYLRDLGNGNISVEVPGATYNFSVSTLNYNKKGAVLIYFNSNP